jgi:predicted DNA-binding transcriptional regulator YafY
MILSGAHEKYIKCIYVNWKGEIAERNLKPIEIRYGTCEPYHRETQWLMYAFDIDKKTYREFAMNKMTDVKELDL